MPIYEYQCDTCESVFELMHAVSAKPIKKCQDSACSGKVSRLVSASGFILKGSGWYATDYPSESRKQGWENEGNKTNPAEKVATGDAPVKEKAPATATPTEKPKPAKKTPAAKSPYSGKRAKKS